MNNDERVLVVCPRGRDAPLICEMLGKQGIWCQPCPDVQALCNEVKQGVGAILLAEEALGPGALEGLSKVFSEQPKWSDIPVVLLTSNGERIKKSGRALFEQSGARGNMVIVERPARILTLSSAVKAALQARHRQYELRDHLQERARNEERLRQSQKLESIGILAGGIAHDFNNLLTGVLGNSSLALDSLPEGSSVRSMIKDVVDATERAAHLTKQLLAYAGKGRFAIEPLDLSQQVREISNLIQTSFPKTVHLRLELAGKLPCIEGDAAQIQQIIMNLVINGAEAIPAGRDGTVLVSTGIQEVTQEYLTSTFAGSELKVGHYVTLEVQDTGMGMDEQTMSHIFDPFFTTKFTGRGLGLAAVMGIVRGHKGALKIYSVPGQGSTFKVLFPAAETVHLVPAKLPVSDSALQGSGIILVIDDEEIVRRTARTALERFGYSVMIAEDGEKGINCFRPIADKVGLVLLDMTMPGLSGEETFRELRTIRPELKVLLSSGFNEVEAIRRFTGKGLAGFLQKPYTSARLAEKIKSVLQTN